MSRRQIAVVDLDGTLCVVGDRRKHLEDLPPDWALFYADSFDDAPIVEVCEVVRLLAREYELLFCTSRRDSVRQKTQIWLQKHLGMTPREYTLIMRGVGDSRPDVVSKIASFMQETTSDERSRVSFVIEDSEAMAAAWRAQGYMCFQVSR